MFEVGPYLDVLDTIPKPETLGGPSLASLAQPQAKSGINWDDIGRALMYAGASGMSSGNMGQAILSGYNAYDQRQQQRQQSDVYRQMFGLEGTVGKDAIITKDLASMAKDYQQMKLDQYYKEQGLDIDKQKVDIARGNYNLDVTNSGYKNSETLVDTMLKSKEYGAFDANNTAKLAKLGADTEYSKSRTGYTNKLTDWLDPKTIAAINHMGVLEDLGQQNLRLNALKGLSGAAPDAMDQYIAGLGGFDVSANPAIPGLQELAGVSTPVAKPQGGVIEGVINDLKNRFSGFMPNPSKVGAGGSQASPSRASIQRNPKLAGVSDSQLMSAYTKAETSGNSDAVKVAIQEMQARGIKP